MTHPPRIFDNVLDTIGMTPLVRLQEFLGRRDVELFAKLESANPGGSAKDRVAHRIIHSALQEGRIQPGGLVVESSSGNTAIAMAQACNLFGLRFRCVVDGRTQRANLQILRALGAEIDMIGADPSGPEDPVAARTQRVAEIVAGDAGAYWPNQHANEHNPSAHDCGTMREIWHALGGVIDYLFVAVSTTGTAVGCQRLLDRFGSSCKIVAVDAVGSVIFGGRPGPRPVPGLGASQRPAIAEEADFYAVERVTPLDCVIGCRRLVRRESILAGGSAGGVLQAVRRHAGQWRPSTRCVAILADHGVRYLDTIFDDEWVERTLDQDPRDVERWVEAEDPTTPGPDEAYARGRRVVRDRLPLGSS